jgi:uncharacterized membrane protein
MKRLPAIDFTRGIVMIIMALDHVRDMIHVDALTESPTNLATTNPLLFFTRWITYLCAPVFVFLAGTSVLLSSARNNDISVTRRFLLKRGLYLILLEITIVNFGLYFDPFFHTLIFEVIAAIGFGFIILSFLLPVSTTIIAIAGLTIIFCHNLFPLAGLPEASLIKKILAPLLMPTAYPIANRVLIIAYPPLPWLGIMMTGYAAGRCFIVEEGKRRSLFVKIGLSAILLFIVIRYINIYGDLLPWSVQRDALFTFLSFLNVAKYPPSLDFCLVTLGVMFLILALATGRKGKIVDIAIVYGKVPLFYFVLHFFLVHTILLAVLVLQGYGWSDLAFATGSFGRPKDAVSGLPLWAIYVTWISVVAVLYQPCKWFGAFKAAHQYWWLRYI